MADRDEGDGREQRRDDDDNPFIPRPRRSGRPGRVERSLSRNDVGNQSRVLVTHFIQDLMERDGYQNRPPPEVLLEPGTPTGPPVENLRQVAVALRRIADELDNDTSLQNIMTRISPSGSRHTFFNVAKYIFSDGNFNWGRIVTLFYFAYKMIVKAMQGAARDITTLCRTIVEWVVTFIMEYVAPWIIDRGGWESIVEHFGTPTSQFIAVFVAGILTGAIFYIWKGLR